MLALLGVEPLILRKSNFLIAIIAYLPYELGLLGKKHTRYHKIYHKIMRVGETLHSLAVFILPQ